MNIHKIGKTVVIGTIATLGVIGASGVAGATTRPASVSPNQPRVDRVDRVEKVEKVEKVAQNGLPSDYACTNTQSRLAHLADAESRVTSGIALAQTRLQTAKADGDTTTASRIGARIVKAQTLKTDLAEVSAMISAKCG